MKRRVLILGLDGATFDVIDPLIEKGWMPELKRLIENGASGPLQSTIPPVTGPAWFALATGMRPEKIGIFDFLYCEGDSCRLRGLTSAVYRGRSVWDYVGQVGKRVGILNYPMILPPYKVNGFITAGIGASTDEVFTFPKSLMKELNKVLGEDYELIVPYHDPRYDDTDLFLKDLHRVFNKHVQVTEYLLREKEWDLFWVVFSETDWLQHLMWRHIDGNHPLYEGAKSKKYAQAFKEFWGKIDEAIGRFRSIVRDEAKIMILSDHGFGPNDQIFKLNAWLEREGYLVRKKQGIHKALNPIKVAVRSSLRGVGRGIRLRRLLPELFEWGRKATESLRVSVLDQIDLERSIAFDPGHTIPFGGIYLNGRLVDTHQKKHKLAGEIAEKLKDWGSKCNVKVEIWQPSSVGNGLDLLVGINDWRCVILKDEFDGELFEQRPYSPRHTGSHRINGIFIVAGPGIQNAKLDRVQICDIVPTLLYLFDRPIPAPIYGHGQVLKEIFNPKYLESHPPKFETEIQAKEGAGSGKAIPDITEEEEGLIQKRLRDLGYM